MFAYTREISSRRPAAIRCHAARHVVSDTGPARRGNPVKVGQRTEDGLVLGPILLRHDMRVLRTASAVFDAALEWTERLGPLAVGTAIPEEPRTVSRSRDRHRATSGAPDSVREWLAVLKVLRGDVAGRARHLAVAAQPCVEEQLSTERCGARVGGVAIRRIDRRAARAYESRAIRAGRAPPASISPAGA